MLIITITPLYTNSSQPFTGLLFLNPVGSDPSSNGIITIQFQDGYITEGYTNIPFTSEGFNLDIGDYCCMWLFGNPDILISTTFVCDKIIQINSVNSIQDIFNSSISSELYSLAECLENNTQLMAEITALKCCIDNLNIIIQQLQNTNGDLESEIEDLNNQISDLNNQISDLNNEISDLNNQTLILNEEINNLQEIINNLEKEADINDIKNVILEAKNNPVNKIKKEDYNNGMVNNERKTKLSLEDLICFIDKEPTETKKIIQTKNFESLFKNVPKEIILELQALEQLETEKNKIKSNLNKFIEQSTIEGDSNKINIDYSENIEYNNNKNTRKQLKELIQRIKNNG